jgi:hypothetical protein
MLCGDDAGAKAKVLGVDRIGVAGSSLLAAGDSLLPGFLPPRHIGLHMAGKLLLDRRWSVGHSTWPNNPAASHVQMLPGCFLKSVVVA